MGNRGGRDSGIFQLAAPARFRAHDHIPALRSLRGGVEGNAQVITVVGARRDHRIALLVHYFDLYYVSYENGARPGPLHGCEVGGAGDVADVIAAIVASAGLRAADPASAKDAVERWLAALPANSVVLLSHVDSSSRALRFSLHAWTRLAPQVRFVFAAAQPTWIPRECVVDMSGAAQESARRSA